MVMHLDFCFAKVSLNISYGYAPRLLFRKSLVEQSGKKLLRSFFAMFTVYPTLVCFSIIFDSIWFMMVYFLKGYVVDIVFYYECGVYSYNGTTIAEVYG